MNFITFPFLLAAALLALPVAAVGVRIARPDEGGLSLQRPKGISDLRYAHIGQLYANLLHDDGCKFWLRADARAGVPMMLISGKEQRSADHARRLQRLYSGWK